MCCRTTGFLTTNLNHKPKKSIKKFVVFRVRHRNTTFYYVFTTLKLSVIRSPAHGFANMLADIRGESCPHIGGKVCGNYFCR